MHIQQPERATRTFTQTLDAPPSTVFPLYCPVREADWIDGWDPIAVYTESGTVEPDCVFVTSDGDIESIWIVTRYDPAAFQLGLVKCTPGVTICCVTVQLAPLGSDRTKATVTYAHTSLGREGDELVAAFTDEYYESLMMQWETAMNHYLKTGECLRSVHRH